MGLGVVTFELRTFSTQYKHTIKKCKKYQRSSVTFWKEKKSNYYTNVRFVALYDCLSAVLSFTSADDVGVQARPKWKMGLFFPRAYM